MQTILILQRTLRMAKFLATWDAFMQTEYYFDLSRSIDADGVKFFRAWWELMADVAPGRECTRQECEFVLATLTARQMQVGYGKSPQFGPHNFGLSEEDGARITELCLSKFNQVVK